MLQKTRNVEEVLDLSQAMTNLDGDAELLQEIIEIFVETGVIQLTAIDNGIKNNDLPTVTIQSHAMKGGASNFCAKKFVSTALKLEMLGKSGSLVGAEDILAKMREYFEEICEVAEVINWREVESHWTE